MFAASSLGVLQPCCFFLFWCSLLKKKNPKNRYLKNRSAVLLASSFKKTVCFRTRRTILFWGFLSQEPLLFFFFCFLFQKNTVCFRTPEKEEAVLSFKVRKRTPEQEDGVFQNSRPQKKKKNPWCCSSFLGVLLLEFFKRCVSEPVLLFFFSFKEKKTLLTHSLEEPFFKRRTLLQKKNPSSKEEVVFCVS